MVASARSRRPAFGIEDTLPMALYSPTNASDQAIYLMSVRFHAPYCHFTCDILLYVPIIIMI
jgi:hypothetical protein